MIGLLWENRRMPRVGFAAWGVGGGGGLAPVCASHRRKRAHFIRDLSLSLYTLSSVHRSHDTLLPLVACGEALELRLVMRQTILAHGCAARTLCRSQIARKGSFARNSPSRRQSTFCTVCARSSAKKRTCLAGNAAHLRSLCSDASRGHGSGKRARAARATSENAWVRFVSPKLPVGRGWGALRKE